MNGPIAVIGAGGWGTGLAVLLSRAGRAVRLWARNPELAARLRTTRVNEGYLPEAVLPETVVVTADLGEALAGAVLALVAVPSIGVPGVAEAMAPCVGTDTVVLSAAKGLEHETGRRMTVVLGEAMPKAIGIGALSGPNLAGEIVAGHPAACVVASQRPEVMRVAQELLACPTFRVYTNPDVAGVELGGALKNPYAIAAGICDGLGYGDNTKAALMTRGMHEMCRLGVALGADARTFAGLCGFGDLLATCHSRRSRNRNLGEKLGRGQPLAEILAQSNQVAEGVPTTRTARRLADERGVEMPIVAELHAVLFEGKPVGEAVRCLMRRDVVDELG